MATGNIRVDGTITMQGEWCDYWGDYDCYYSPTMTFEYLREQCDWECTRVEGVDSLKVTINSPGGLCDVGYQMYDYLTTCGKKITTVVQGACESIATVVFMAGSTRLIPRNSSLMIHLPQGSATGDVRLFEAYTAEMFIETQKLIDFYVRTTGQTQEVIAELLAGSSVLSAERAVELGFATGILEPISARAFASKQTIHPVPAAATPAPSVPVSQPIQRTKQQVNMSMKTRVAALVSAIVNFGSGAEPTNLTLKLADGKNMEVSAAGETETEGDTVTIDGVKPDDGEYTLENGTVITLKDGAIDKIVEVTSDEAAADATDDANTESGTTDVENNGQADASGTGGTTEAPTNNADQLAQLQAQVQTLTRERDEERARTSNLLLRVDRLGALMGDTEAPPVVIPGGGSNATPSQQRSSNRAGSESVEDAMKEVAGHYSKPKKTGSK